MFKMCVLFLKPLGDVNPIILNVNIAQCYFDIWFDSYISNKIMTKKTYMINHMPMK